MLAEYAFTYGGPPAATMPWPLFMACVKRAPSFQARELLRQADAVLWGIGRAFSKENAASIEMRNHIERIAYPWGRPDDPFLIRGNDAGA